MDCILLAGGVPQPGEGLFDLTRGTPKALYELGGKPIGQRVLDALTGAANIDRVILVGVPPDAFSSPKLAVSIPSRGGLVDNFLAGVEQLQPAEPLAAACSSDIPLVTAEMVDWFIDTAGTREATGGVIRRTVVERTHPDYPTSYWRLTDGQFTAADFVVFRPSAARGRNARLEAFAAARKSTWRTARLIGWGLLIRYLMRRLSLAEARRRVSRTLDLDVGILEVPFPEMGLDLDLPEHVAALERAIRQRRKPDA